METGVLIYNAQGNLMKLRGTQQGAAHVVQAAPSLSKWVQEGKVWQAIETTATAFVIALPTTTAGFSMYNDEPDTGKWYVVLGALAWQAANAATQASWGIAHQVSSVKPATKPTADLAAATIVKGLRANMGTYNGRAIFDLALSVADDRWAPVSGSVNTVVVSLSGTQLYIPLAVPVHLPPGGVYSVEGIASAVDITGKLGFVWAEVYRDELE